MFRAKPALFLLAATLASAQGAYSQQFHLQEATIDDIHRAIQNGQITCVRPFSLVFRAEQGKEDVILKVASVYEAASKRRLPPPDFGPLPGEP